MGKTCSEGEASINVCRDEWMLGLLETRKWTRFVLLSRVQKQVFSYFMWEIREKGLATVGVSV